MKTAIRQTSAPRRRLILSCNSLTGPILTHLYLHDNAIPAALGRLASVTRLDLGDNELTGAIPPELGNLTSISRMRLANNQLSGPLPATLGNLAGLQVLDVTNNAELSGPLPRTFLSLGQVEELRTSGTELCAPMDRDFRNWMDRVLIHRTSACGAHQLTGHTADGEELFSFRFEMPETGDGGEGSFAFALPAEPVVGRGTGRTAGASSSPATGAT